MITIRKRVPLVMREMMMMVIIGGISYFQPQRLRKSELVNTD